jgi:hypothetical protein
MLCIFGRFWIEYLRTIPVAAMDGIGDGTVMGFTGSCKFGAVGKDGLPGEETGGLSAAPTFAALSLSYSTWEKFLRIIGFSWGMEM